jgi:hypothetical protein
LLSPIPQLIHVNYDFFLSFNPPELSFILGKTTSLNTFQVSTFCHPCLKSGRFHSLIYEQEILVPQQEGFRDALTIVHAERAGIVAPVRRIALHALQFLSG